MSQIERPDLSRPVALVGNITFQRNIFLRKLVSVFRSAALAVLMTTIRSSTNAIRVGRCATDATIQIFQFFKIRQLGLRLLLISSFGRCLTGSIMLVHQLEFWRSVVWCFPRGLEMATLVFFLVAEYRFCVISVDSPCIFSTPVLHAVSGYREHLQFAHLTAWLHRLHKLGCVSPLSSTLTGVHSWQHSTPAERRTIFASSLELPWL